MAKFIQRTRLKTAKTATAFRANLKNPSSIHNKEENILKDHVKSMLIIQVHCEKYTLQHTTRS